MSLQSQSNFNIELTPPQKDQIQKLQKLFNQADGLAKEVEDFIGEAGIPALNEMRYAGYHLAHSILLKEGKVCDEQIVSAVNHCKRACYEASEAGIVVALLKFDEFRSEYKTLVISEVITEWRNIQKDFKHSQQDVRAARDKGEDRSIDYETRMEAFRKIKDHCDTLDYAKDDLNAIKRREIKSFRRFFITTLIALLALVVAITFGLTQYTRTKTTNIPPNVSSTTK